MPRCCAPPKHSPPENPDRTPSPRRAARSIRTPTAWPRSTASGKRRRSASPPPVRRRTQPAQQPAGDDSMSETLNQILFGLYPHVAISVFLLGSLVRFEREQYTWRSGSSQILRRRLMV